MKTALRGTLLGAGYGVATVTVSAGFGVFQTLSLGFPINALAFLEAAVLDIAAGAVLGLVAAPLLTLRAGVLWHLLLLAAIWFGSGLAVLPGQFFLTIVLVPAAVGLLLALLGAWVARRSRLLAGGLVGCFVPG